MDWSAIVVGVLTVVGALVGTYFSNRKSQALVEYRLEQLEKKVDLHNKVVERTFRLEEAVALLETEEHRQNERIRELEANGK